MKDKSLGEEVFDILKNSSLETAQQILDAWRSELLTFHVRKQLKEEFSEVAKLVELASKVTIKTYHWMRLDYRVMEKCTFRVSYNDRTAAFSWSHYYERGGGIDEFFCNIAKI